MKTFIIERYKDYTVNQMGRRMKLHEMIENIPHCNTKNLEPEIASVPLVGWGSNIKQYKYPDQEQIREPMSTDAKFAA